LLLILLLLLLFISSEIIVPDNLSDINNNNSNNISNNQQKIHLENLKSSIKTYDKNNLNNSHLSNKKTSIEKNENNNINNNNNNLTENSITLFLYDNNNILLDSIEITPTTLKSNTNNISQKEDKKFSFGKKNSCDYLLNYENISPIQFYINYNENTKKFQIFDNLLGTGIFLKIDKIILLNNMIINIGIDYMHFEINEKNNNEIKIKFLKKNEEISFNSKNFQSYTIGRNKNCNYIYNDDRISKVQCTIFFNGEQKWEIYDGIFLIDDVKKSSNGLWLLANKGIYLEQGMILKTGDLKLKVNKTSF
jgi:hypothetical protein